MSKLSIALKNRARSWAGQLTSLARSFAPSHVRPAISSHVEEKAEGTYIIRLTANRQMAPDARAQELGSGLHSRRGIKAKYPIRPKNKKVLAFHWDVASTFEMERGRPGRFIFAPDGRVLLPSVMHPGIQAANQGKGYLAPAVKELRKHARANLTKDVREAILSDIRKSFGRKA